ncbi:aldehyde dehydrogenase family protein [Rhodococcus sp. NPDC003348]
MSVDTVHARLAPATVEFLGRTHGHFVDDTQAAASDGGTRAVVDPATEQEIARVAEGTGADVENAVAAAAAAHRDDRWRGLAPARRAAVLRRWSDLVAADSQVLAELETLENGAPLALTRGWAHGSSAILAEFAGWPERIAGRVNPGQSDVLSYSVRQPVGVVAAITPWNVPLIMAVNKLAPALAAGNTVVLKPAEDTPLTALRLAELGREAGLPAGALGVVTGSGPGVGVPLVEHPLVNKVSFTGSTGVGKEILARAATSVKRVSLELGGKSPNIVFADADLDAAALAAQRAVWTNSGQICFAGTRLLVERTVHDRVVDAVVDGSRNLVIGNGFVDGVDLGPLISARQRNRVADYLALARTAGAGFALDGGVVDGPGYFVRPTVLTGVDNSSRVAQDEIFGPVLTVIPFDTEDEAIALANDTVYGLAASIWTDNLARAHRVAARLDAGSVWVNRFGPGGAVAASGGFKQSGLGRDGGDEWLHSYTELKSVTVQIPT